ncbi:DnaA/Hda family protein [Tautonia rosea]|uniref:DnaA/Hda family protein n=1 Tax=Tautonia rosea TaxID=2728037 RepID=UPI00147649FB|nr:DnaA/Hda family protein [Tautonia rosea]
METPIPFDQLNRSAPDPPRSGPWDGFLVGPENELAQAAIRELARGQNDRSPLVLVGPSGSGKTRLLEELIADCIARRPNAAVALMPSEVFVDACHRAADRDTPAAWAELRRSVREVDLLAIDDLHGISRSPLSLAELEPTLDALDAAGASVAVSLRNDPGRWAGWPRRLADRLQVGLTVRLDRPGPATRRRYLLDQVRRLGLTATAEALDALAESAEGYRLIDGWLARVALMARLDRRPIDLALVNTLIHEDQFANASVSIAQITQVVARSFGLRPRDLRSSSRRATLVEARHLAILLARELTGASYADLGKAFGGRDPKTIRHACLATTRRIADDPALASVAEAIHRQWPMAVTGRNSTGSSESLPQT